MSPNGSQVALALERGVFIVDPARRRVVERIGDQGYDPSVGLVWTGRTRLGYPLLIAVGESEFGYEYTLLEPFLAGGATDTDAWPVAALREGLVVSDHAEGMIIEGDGEWTIHLSQMPDGPFAAAADVAGDRLFVVSAAGVVGEVDDAAHGARVSYHQVALNGKPFQALWAGDGRIALWGADGLGLIDTRDWSTHAVASGVTDVTRTSYGLLATSAEGLTLYRPTGARAFRALDGRTIRSVVAVGRYAYASTTSGRFSIDLATGRVTGPLPSRARIVQPSLNGPLPVRR